MLAEFEQKLNFGRNKSCRWNQLLQFLFWELGQNPNIYGITDLWTLGKISENINSVKSMKFNELQLTDLLKFWIEDENS